MASVDRRVAGQEGDAGAPQRPGRRPVAALDVPVHQVVVEEREIVDQFDGHPARGAH